MIFSRSFLFFCSLFLGSSLYAHVNDYFNQIKTDPNALYLFFKTMPKGGELHYHLVGGPYAESMLSMASGGNYCINLTTFKMSKTDTTCEGLNIKDLLNQPAIYSSIVKAWSMKDFISNQESGEEHFFNTFAKFILLVTDYRPQFIANVIQRAAQQQALYMEIMDIPDDAHSIHFGKLLNNNQTYEAKRQLLLSNPHFQDNIKLTITQSDKAITEAYDVLGCNINPDKKACKVKIKLLYYVLREQPLNNLFAQALNAFEAVSRSKGNLVGVNLVQPESGILSLRDYHQQMLVFNYLHSKYPQVNITLHAGELAPGLVTPEELSFHISDALMTGQAQRIGHGVSIAYENDAKATLDYLAKNNIPVEINLISNLKILNIKGREHPLNLYLAHHVPIVLSTDDEGILRTDLTHQYVEAALKHGIDYQTLKQINRNALTYAFLPGKSIWHSAIKAELIQDCFDLNSTACLKFVEHSEKAKLQRDLELLLIRFEKTFN